jgi:hypothetical protein
MKFRIRHLFALLIAAGVLSSVGCKTNDDDDIVRPWNGPKTWETGLPAALTEGR